MTEVLVLPSPSSRADVVRFARGWIGTPYHHQASSRGAGADCLGLIRGVWRDIYGAEAEQPPAYSRDWGEADNREPLLTAARRLMVEIDPDRARPGDVLIFRMRPLAPAKHIAILVSDGTMVHAMEGRNAAEVPLSRWWRRRIAAAFTLRGISD